jgi:isopropylmalate/homocitrate/citramalate synthase
MSYALNITKEADHLHIEATGTRTPETLMAVAKDCVDACKNHGYTRFFLDVQGMRGQLSTIDTYQFATKPLLALGRGLGLKAAIIDVGDNIERLRFFENVAVNIGMDLRVFSNASRALQWLLGPKESEGE